MSPAKEDLLKELTPFFDAMGYRLYKSKSSFIKRERGFEFKVYVRFEGSGVLTMVDWIDAEVTIEDIGKICKKIMGYSIPMRRIHISHSKNDAERTIQIPMMYSQPALDLANAMNLHKLAKLSYEEKYPRRSIERCARVIESLLSEMVFRDFEKGHGVFDEFERLSDFLENPAWVGEDGWNCMQSYDEEEDDYRINKIYFMYFLLLLKKLKIPHSNLVKEKMKQLPEEDAKKIMKFIKE